MKAVLMDGTIKEGPLRQMCSGYRAQEIYLDHNDVKSLSLMNDRDLRAMVMQLSARVPVFQNQLHKG